MPRSLRVLVADDDADCREVLRYFLELHGHIVETASDGLEALDVARKFHPDLVFLDLWMPRMSGLEACRRLRGDLCAPSILIYAVTADPPQTSASHCFDDVFVKPLDFERLSSFLQEGRPRPRTL